MSQRCHNWTHAVQQKDILTESVERDMGLLDKGLPLAVVTASPRTCPLLICSIIALPPIWRSIRPAIVSVSAGASPRYGTCVISMPAICLNNSPARCGTVPTPGDANVTLPLLSLANAMNSATDL